ncbi:MAG: hypothetical protein HQ534_09515 [Armatimonadetes bacterium]|nr:hypothetical protein [Armatimonadota bacterium]
MRLTKENLVEKYKSNPKFIEKSCDLFSLKFFFSRCIISDKYIINKQLDEAIVLTDAGEKLFTLVSKKIKSPEDSIKIKLLIFLKFYHTELLVDVLKTNLQIIEKILDQEIKKNKIKFPWIFGRTLYNKYFNEFNEQFKNLDFEDTMKLLNGTPQGVFQVGKYVIGPLGLLISSTKRHNLPQRSILLHHCSDPSCTAYHRTSLHSYPLLVEIEEEIDKHLPESEPSEFGQYFGMMIEEENEYYDYDQLSQSSKTIANIFGEKELKSLLKNVIEQNGNIRDSFPKLKEFKGSVDQIVNKLDKAKSFQLLLIEKDTEIIRVLEQLISEDIIHLPATEIREVHAPIAIGFYDIKHQCNKLGFRSISYYNLSINRLNKLILHVNDDESEKQLLEWKLKFIKFDSLKQKLEYYTSDTDPQQVIKETILSGPVQIKKVFDFLYGHFVLPNNEHDEKKLINKILWKLGFSINIYPNAISDFWSKLSNFENTVNKTMSSTSGAKDEIRSSSVNLFVSLEQMLEESLSFSTWFLLSDHYFSTKFNYDFESARSFMCDKLEGSVVGSNDPLRFDKNGRNTLFPLSEGFTALINLCDLILKSPNKEYLRDKAEYPSFYEKTNYTSYPFLHKILLLDIKENCYQRLKEILSVVAPDFNKNNVLSIRNRLQHNREDFPNTTEILSACNSIRKIVSSLEENCLYPNVYLFKSMFSDKYKRVSYVFEDYKGNIINIQPTFEFIANKLISMRDPQIILPQVCIGDSLEVIRFKYNESSEYLKYWKGFPLKKLKHTILDDLSKKEIVQ